jgi:hypothetical protein
VDVPVCAGCACGRTERRLSTERHLENVPNGDGARNLKRSGRRLAREIAHESESGMSKIVRESDESAVKRCVCVLSPIRAVTTAPRVINDRRC